MNRHQRIEEALRGGTPDRVPVSAWGHFYHLENSAEAMARSMLAFQERYDWDYMKVNPRASYHCEGFGAEYTQSGVVGARPVCTRHPLHAAGDWRKLVPLSPSEGALGEHLRALDTLRRGLAGRVPFMMTVFSPLMIASFLAGLRSDFSNLRAVAGAVLGMYREDPQAVRAGLAAIAETFAAYVRRLAAGGVDGIYYATVWGSDLLVTPEEYRSLARPWDLQVLEAAAGLPFNMLHVCGNRIHFESMADYPAHAIHWDNHGERNPPLDDPRARPPRVIAGGVHRGLLASGTPEQVGVQAREALRATGGRSFLLAPSCAIALAETPEANLRALRAAVEN